MSRPRLLESSPSSRSDAEGSISEIVFLSCIGTLAYTLNVQVSVDDTVKVGQVVAIISEGAGGEISHRHYDSAGPKDIFSNNPKFSFTPFPAP